MPLLRLPNEIPLGKWYIKYWSDRKIHLSQFCMKIWYRDSVCRGSTGYINNSLRLVGKYAWIFVCKHCLFLRSVQFSEWHLRRTVNFKEQIMSKDKYPSILSYQMEAIVFIILDILTFLQHLQILKLGNITQISPSFSWCVFSHMTHAPWPKYLMDYK